MRILLTGKNGQVGRELLNLLPSLGTVAAFGREELDLTSADAIRKTIPDAMRNIMTCEPSYIMMGMSAETFWGGLEGNKEFEDRLREQIGPDIGLTSGAAALRDALDKFGAKRVIMSTYQAASGAGQPGMDELTDGTRVYLEGGKPENNIFAYPLPFNVIPQIDKFQDNGYTKEEMKVTWETRKICGLADDFPVSCSAVRIPTIRAHSEVIILETEQPVNVKEAQQVLDAAPGVKLVDNPDKLEYPMPLTATGEYDVEVGRVRKSLVFGDYGLEFFVCGDQLLRGAALNAVLVGEEMAANGSL